MSWSRIDAEAAEALIASRQPAIVDVRDAASYQSGRLPGARLLDNQSVRDFMAETDKATPVLVYCYHGNSSQGASAWLAQQGFTEVYSLDGGFEFWKIQHAVER